MLCIWSPRRLVDLCDHSFCLWAG